jgi:hypothetical protein
MYLLTELTQPHGSELQVMRIDGGVYVAETLTAGGEIIAGEGVIIDVSNIDAVIAALQEARRDLRGELARCLETAAE